MKKNIVISRQFNGPPTTGNGGYVCGLLADPISGAAEATLKVPPPLEADLVLESDGESSRLLAGDQLIGEARKVDLDLELPFEIDAAAVLDGLPDTYGMSEQSPFSTCFVCGPDRDHGDGLCIYTHPIDGHEGAVAGRWTLDAGFADSDGMVDKRHIWAALDCPGYFACSIGDMALLARMTTKILAPLRCEGDALIVGWTIAKNGRKRDCGTALVGRDGTLHAISRGLWITLDPSRVATS
ncbi:hypothetical protein GCM10017044_06340 [Kordiimonas sediminis]|uniref:Uncharacterized protein n=1 Tax=Kordiimonas sediminis TaxID=1735581 RepID=A0A919ALX8_9PROT|nr:hypothetical protein [Kordiimonas sediminis]GHF14942.1 hypothetical protein GCM10017044_06340 [Kordiimonas sediminis]